MGTRKQLKSLELENCINDIETWNHDFVALWFIFQNSSTSLDQETNILGDQQISKEIARNNLP